MSRKVTWTDNDLAELRTRFAYGQTHMEIALAIDKSQGSVARKLWDLKLFRGEGFRGRSPGAGGPSLKSGAAR